MRDRDRRYVTGAWFRGGWRRLGLVVAVPFAVLLAVACEGDNLFSESATDFLPRLTSLSVQDAIAGDSARVRIEAEALRGIAEIEVSVRGAISRDTIVDVSPPETRLTAVISFGVPLGTGGQQIIVQAHVVDETGKLSRSAEVVAQVN